MEKKLYIKYGELTLKGKNKMNFINCLFNNVKNAIKDYQLKIIKSFDNILISNINNDQYYEILDILKSIPGIATIIEAYLVERTDQALIHIIKNNFTNEQKTFKIETKRIDKNFHLDSMQFSKEFGGVVLSNFTNWKVNLHKPQVKFKIEIKNDCFVIFWNKHKGLGGFPLGINGKVLVLLSGGLDSPVASHLLMKKGMHVDFLTFISPPHTTDEALEKVISLIKQLTLNSKLQQSKLYICTFTNIQHELSHISNSSYQITLMRRYFFRIAKKIADDNKYDAIATGESLGQVASQTIASMNCISNSIMDTLVLRPLLTLDKSEIIEISKKIGTYDISILPFADSCSLFVPANPTTNPSIKNAIKLECELELIDDIVESTIKNFIDLKLI